MRSNNAVLGVYTGGVRPDPAGSEPALRRQLGLRQATPRATSARATRSRPGCACAPAPERAFARRRSTTCSFPVSAIRTSSPSAARASSSA
jgi:hypothetical protein